MGKWKKDKEGRFTGSIGSGKDNIPGPSPLSNLSEELTGNKTPAPSFAGYEELSKRVHQQQARLSNSIPPELSALTAAEREVRQAEERWENARSWAYPGVGDPEAEQELNDSYEELSLARENLHRARILAGQSAEGQAYLEAEMDHWNARALEAADGGDGALKYLVRAQEIYDSLAEARRQREVEEEFRRILGSDPSSAEVG